MFHDMLLESLVLESATFERFRALRIPSNPGTTAGHFPSQLNVVPGGDPAASHRQIDGLRFAKNAITVGGLSQRFAEIPVVEAVVHIVDHHYSGPLQRNGS